MVMTPAMREQFERLARRLAELDATLSDPTMASDIQRWRALSREQSEAQDIVARFRQFQQRESDLQTAQEMRHDPEMAEMAGEEITAARADMERLHAELLTALVPRDPDDERNAFLEIRAGTGGDESALFAGDLARMYLRHCERQGWRTEVLSQSDAELGGYKELVLRIEGEHVYGDLRFESGGHRVQRVPATESQGRIHTSACTVAVMPEPDAAQEIQLNPADLRIDTFRASGAGGQHVNKTDSAIRITHIPTGIVVSCQAERSQHKNRATAWNMLRARLYEAELQKREAAQKALESTKTEIGWGRQIRSYVLQPYQMVKDLRTGVETSDSGGVLDGDLDAFMAASLAARVNGTEAAVADID